MINGIEITDVIIFPVRQKTEGATLKAFARVVLNNQFLITGIRVYEGKNGPFMKFPQEYNKAGGKGYDVCFPTTAGLRSYISDQVLRQYSIAIGVTEPVDA